MSNVAKSFDIPAISLSVFLHNYFNNPIKLFRILYLTKFLEILETKPSFSYKTKKWVPYHFKLVINPSRHDRLFPTNSTLKFCNFADEIRRSNRRSRKDLGQKGASIALFHWRLSKIIILSVEARISLIPWDGGVVRGWSKPAEYRRKGWIAGVRCGMWSALLAQSTVSTSPNRRFCRTYHFSSVLLHKLRTLRYLNAFLALNVAWCLYSWCLCSLSISHRPVFIIPLTHAPNLSTHPPINVFRMIHLKKKKKKKKKKKNKLPSGKKKKKKKKKK